MAEPPNTKPDQPETTQSTPQITTPRNNSVVSDPDLEAPRLLSLCASETPAEQIVQTLLDEKEGNDS